MVLVDWLIGLLVNWLLGKEVVALVAASFFVKKWK
jgi:hypothetical protein